MRRREVARTVGEQSDAREFEVLEQVLSALQLAIHEAAVADRIIVETLTGALQMSYGAVWVERDDAFHLSTHVGDLVPVLEPVSRPDGTLARTDGMLGVAVDAGRPVLIGGAEHAARCLRWRTAQDVGMVGGCVVPLVWDGRTVAVYEFYSATPMPMFDDGGDKWSAIARIAAIARNQALLAGEQIAAINDQSAVTAVVERVGSAADVQTALLAALETVRTTFGWAYGSFWAADEDAQVLRFAHESGSAGEEFRRVTESASFAEGVGLSGRAWQQRALVFVPDLGKLTDCVRAPAAQRAGVRSGVCFPILIEGRVVGTMDFFATETIKLSESRLTTLKNVAQLVSQQLGVLDRIERDERRADELLRTVHELRAAADDAGQVASAVAAHTEQMAANVIELTTSSAAIDDVIKLISGIARQTNLLALNATIEAARAGRVGQGFAVVAHEVKELARETASATVQVSDRVTAIQESGRAVAEGIGATRDIVTQLGTVQARIGDALQEQADMARTLVR